MSKNELNLFKLIAVGAALLYLYKLSKAQGTSLAGNPYAEVKSEQVVNLASEFIPKEYRPYARKIGNAVMTRINSL